MGIVSRQSERKRRVKDRHLRIRSILWLFALLVAGALAPATADAQQSTTQKLEAIRAQMEKGQAFYIAGQYEKAIQEFDTGYAQYKYSAFLFNAGVCATKLNNVDKALEKFRRYVQVDPGAPDIEKVKERIGKLEAAKAAAVPAPPVATDGGIEGGATGVEGGVVDAGPAKINITDQVDDMRSLVVIETDPTGAPLTLFRKTTASAPEFKVGAANAGWTRVTSVRAPANVTLAVGDYHVVVEKFRDFNVSSTEVRIEPGKVLHFKANLSQGAFMAFLRVSANTDGAHIYLDDDRKKRPEWGRTPYGELIPAGEHSLLVEKPGFQSLRRKVMVKHGDQTEIQVKLERVPYGIVRVISQVPKFSVSIDEEPVGVWNNGEPVFERQVDAGQHKIKITSSGRKTWKGLIDVPRGQVLPVRATLIPKQPRGGAWTFALLSAASIGTGVYLGITSDDLHKELKSDREAGVLDQNDSRVDKGRFLALGADGAFAIGGLFAVVSAINFIKDPLPESSAQYDELADFHDPLVDPPKEQPDPAGIRRPPHMRGAPPGPAAPGAMNHVKRGKLARKNRAPERQKKPKKPPRISIAPGVSNRGGGIVLGGTF